MDVEQYLCGNCNKNLTMEQLLSHPCFQDDSKHNESLLESNISPPSGAASNPMPSMNTISLEEKLIELVAEWPALWDHHLPLTHRSKLIKEKLWLEIQKNLKFGYSIATLQKKWKGLKDYYFKIKADINPYVPSGSGAIPKKASWKFYEQMQFLRDVNEQRQSITNMNEAQQSHDSEVSQQSTESSLESVTQKEHLPGKRKRKIDIDMEILKSLEENSKTSDPAPAAATLIPKINPICLRLSDILDSLPLNKRAKLEVELLQKACQLMLSDDND